MSPPALNAELLIFRSTGTEAQNADPARRAAELIKTGQARTNEDQPRETNYKCPGRRAYEKRQR